MTSARGQNVSVLHFHGSVEPWDPPITTFTDSGGSLRSAPRSGCFKIDGGGPADGKSSGRSFVGNSSSRSFPKSQEKAFASGKGFNVTVTSGEDSSFVLNTGNRELSPVRWCDREVDGVYLGKSGWVQVHQRSSGNGNVGVSTLPPRIRFSNIFSGEVVGGKIECNRPSFLPLPQKKRVNRGDQERACYFFQDLDSVSPPSLTPIISPPPAFKDREMDGEFHAESDAKTLSVKSSFLLRSKAVVESGNPLEPKEKWGAPDASSSGFPLSSASPSNPRGHRPRMPQTKSLDDTFSSRRQCDRSSSRDAALSFFGFRSLDSEIQEVEPFTFEKEHCIKKRFDNGEKERNGSDCDDRGNGNDEEEKGFCERHLSRPRSSPREVPNGQRTLPRPFRHRNPQRNGRRISGSDFVSTLKYKEKCLDSSTSSCDSNRSSPDRKSPTKISRKHYSKQSEQMMENCFAGDGNHFNVKRSTSLQLSEKRSPNEFLLMTHSSSGKSWDRMPLEYSGCSERSQRNSKRLQSLQPSQQLAFRPNASSGDESPLNFRRAEEEKIMKEADKEVRIITEFLNGTRCREAARNLLLHRYLNRPEDDDPATVPPESKSESEHGKHFLSADRQPQQPEEILSGRTQPGERQFYSLTRDFRRRTGVAQFQPFTFFLRDSGVDSGRFVGAKPPQTFSDKKKMKKVGKKNGGVSISAQESSNESDWKKNGRPGRRSLDRLRPVTSNEKFQVFPSRQLDKWKTFLEENSEKPHNKRGCLSPGSESETEERRSRRRSFDDSSSASSWSSDFWRDCSPAKNANGRKSSGTGSPSESGAPGETSRSRPGSAPTNDITARGIDQRSLSLPRSFLSDLCGFQNLHHGSVFPRKLQESANSHVNSSRWVATKENARTAPATPVNDLEGERRKESVNGISSIRSSTISVASEPPTLSKPRFGAHKPGAEIDESLATNGNLSLLSADKLSVSNSGSSSKSVLQKFKKNFSSKFIRTKEMAKEGDLCMKNEKERDSEKENSSIVTSGLIFGFQNLENGDKASEELLRGSSKWKGAREQKLWRKAVRSRKYGSHDSGIQMGNRGNLDSSESQDTDLQEEIDSPISVRRRGIHQEKDNCSRPQSEVFGQILFDTLKGKGVRRTNSDLGGQRLYNWDVKNHYRRNLRSIRGRNPATLWPRSNEGVLRSFIADQKRPQLRRSMSQPLGLNELPSFVRRSSAAKCLTLSEDEQNLQAGHGEEEFVSDSESSIASLGERKKVSEFSLSEETVVLAEAVWDHVSMEPSELPFKAGDVIEVLDTRDRDWWWGARGQNCGYFPSVFVRLRVSQEDTVEDCLAAMAKGTKNSAQVRRGKSVSLLSNDQVRAGVVKELLNTERDFVKVLRNVREGFVFECRRRSDMFNSAQITAIFSNLEDLLVFQEKFLKDLEERVDRGSPHESCIGGIFLNYGSGFRMYSEYCNSHPMAIATLQELYQNERYVNFFETCRLKRNLIEIPLDGYLLTPVQRICKYPLQLAELLKYTKPEHPDFEAVRDALETMRSVATLINERKRKMESLEKLAGWQQRVEGWEGEDLIETSSQLIHQGDVVRMTSGMWTSNITLFLFDHQIVYCKKDMIKRNTYIYKGRIFLDKSEVIDIPDGKDQQLGVTVRTAEDKAKWLEAFAEEKKIVTQDREGGLNLPPAAKELARMAARTKRGPPVKHNSKNNKIGTGDGELSSRSIRSDAPKAKIGRRVGTWFTFGGGKGSRIGPGLRSVSQKDT